MNLAAAPLQMLESLDRRMLGALRFVDAVSGLPVNGLMRIGTRGATEIRPRGSEALPLYPGEVRFVRNRAGLFIIVRAPLFNDYAGEFLAPEVPVSLQGGILRLRLALTTVDAGYLPQEFDYDLPRSLSAGSAAVLHSSGNVDGLVLEDAPFSVPIIGGQFTVNGQTIAVQTNDTLAQVFTEITTATGGAVTGVYDAAADQIVLTGNAPIALGGSADTSNFLVISRLAANGRQVVRSHGRVAGSVFAPLDVPLFRSPSARAESGWIVVRTRVVKTGTGVPLPGVLVRVFRSPRMPLDAPVGLGLSDWRGRASGEALVTITGIPRFRPGSGDSVVETEQPVEFEAVRDPSFTGATEQLPQVTSLLSGSGPGQIIASPAVSVPASMNVHAGGEYTVTLTMP